MTIVNVIREGMRRVNRAPAIIAGAWFMTALYALPFAFAVTVYPLGQPSALVNSGAIAGRVSGWWVRQVQIETIAPVRDIGRGIAAAVRSPLPFLMDESRIMVTVASSLPYLIAWLFLAGGIIDRYARNRPTHAIGFFTACSLFFFRFIRLGGVMLGTYTVAIYVLGRWPIALWPALAFGNLIFDYAQVRAVVEDRRSMIGSMAAALGFIRRHWRSALLIYAIDCLLFAIAVAIYVILGPASFPLRFAFSPLVWPEQLYVVARLWVRLVFWATETTLFQSRLAHAGYVAAPHPVWPDSAAAEAIRNIEL